MNTKKVAELIAELALEIDCTKYEILDNLVGMVLSEEEVGELQEAF
jgi:hypothetical protein